MTFDDVAAVLVTRGDVDMQPILDSLPYGEVIIWDNSKRSVDYKVFGRYVGIFESTKPVIYFQDDDCIVSCHEELLEAYEPGVVVGNAFNDKRRLAIYHDTTLLGWGSIFDRDLPRDAFIKYLKYYPIDWEFKTGLGAEIVFPMLSKTKTILHGVEWLEEDGLQIQHRDNRMWKAPNFYRDVDFWLARAREVRDRDLE